MIESLCNLLCLLLHFSAGALPGCRCENTCSTPDALGCWIVQRCSPGLWHFDQEQLACVRSAWPPCLIASTCGYLWLMS